jgi:hypothetical protein
MMIDRETALNTLRLSAQANRADIVTAYSRLARRYPLQQFPERHTRLLEAKTALLSPELGFRDMLFEEAVDLSWLNRYPTEEKTNQDTVPVGTSPVSTPPHPKQFLEALFRPHLKKNLELSSMDAGMEDELAQILDDLGGEGLQELIERLNFP